MKTYTLTHKQVSCVSTLKKQMRLTFLLYLALAAGLPAQSLPANTSSATEAAALRTRIEASPTLPFHGVFFPAHPPTTGWQSGAVSGIAIDRAGTIYEIQRGDKADPVLVLNPHGKLLRSWGKGSYSIPHSIRIDPKGNLWTVDAGSSTLLKFSPRGKKLLTIQVGEQPNNGSPFNGTTDIAFGPRGHLFIADGYGNTRVLEYMPDGRRLKQWGKPGTGPGDFHLPHAIQIDDAGILYVADRENGRIQKFDLAGNFLAEIPHLGRIYSLKLAHGALWASMEPFDESPGSGSGWIVKLDPDSGKLLGHIDVPQPQAGHAIDLMPSGEPIITLGNKLLWFKAR